MKKPLGQATKTQTIPGLNEGVISPDGRNFGKHRSRLCPCRQRDQREKVCALNKKRKKARVAEKEPETSKIWPSEVSRVASAIGGKDLSIGVAWSFKESGGGVKVEGRAKIGSACKTQNLTPWVMGAFLEGYPKCVTG